MRSTAIKNDDSKAANGNITAQIHRFGNEAGISDGETKEQLRRMAREVLSGISEIDPSHSRELLGVFVLELVLLSEEEERRAMRRQKQAEGIAAAKERGVQFGRERMELPDNFPEFARMWQQGGISCRRAAKELGISHQTFRRRAKEYFAVLV